jgi:hypothetical protein
MPYCLKLLENHEGFVIQELTTKLLESFIGRFYDEFVKIYTVN